jgi:hypothetical protein
VEELPDYARATHFLATLGMQDYQRNLKRGLLNDSTLHLWNERSASSHPWGAQAAVITHDRALSVDWESRFVVKIPLHATSAALKNISVSV